MTLLNGENKEIYSAYSLTDVEECFTLDECGFMMSKETYCKFPFMDLGKTWHLYAVELCLRLKKNGAKVGVMPVDAWHRSLGQLTSNYYKTFIKICRRYRRDFEGIYTCCVSVDFADKWYYFKLKKRWFHLKLLELRRRNNK